MTLHEFFEKLERETRRTDPLTIRVEVLSRSSHRIVSAEVIDVGLDENHGILYIEINKVGEEEE